MTRALLLNRAVALHRPIQGSNILRSFSTSKPSKGEKEKQQKSLDTASDDDALMPQKNKRGRPKKANGPPLLIPPRRKQSYASIPKIPIERFHPTGTFAHNRWTLNVSPIRMSKEWSRLSAFYTDNPSVDGNKAMIRLNKARKELVETLRQDLLESNNKNASPRPYVLVGHGIPQAVLQSNVDFCDFLLKIYNNATEISFKGLTSKLMSFDVLQICEENPSSLSNKPALPPERTRRDEPWPFTTSSEEFYQTELYLTVMRRLCVDLSRVLWHEAPPPPPASVDEDSDDDFVRVAPSSLSTTLHHWKVEFVRGSSEHPLDPFLTPIVQWNLPENNESNGHITVRLRGQPSRASSTKKNRRRKAPLEVTMIFRATFENPFREE